MKIKPVDLSLFKTICQTFAPSGREALLLKKIEKEVSGYADEIRYDGLGSLLVLKKGVDSTRKMMFAAHADEIGVVVTFIDEKGFARFSTIGGVVASQKLGGARVQFANGTVGVISRSWSSKKEIDISQLYIDLGTHSKAETEAFIGVGDFAVFTGDWIFQNNFIISKALDNRCGCMILIEALKQMEKPAIDSWFVFTTQEEVGYRGAGTAAGVISPDYAITVDVTLCGDTPEALPLNMEIGKGVSIKSRDRSIIVPTLILDYLSKTAEKNKIPHQMEVLPYEGSDAGAIQLVGEGIVCGTISVPCRYHRTPSEMIHLSDVENCLKLILALCQSPLAIERR